MPSSKPARAPGPGRNPNAEEADAEPPETSWEAQLAKLKVYKREHGDCSVPQAWAADPGLGSWVKNQRYRKKKLDRGEPNPKMTAARAAKLEALGFAWEGSSGRRAPAGARPAPGIAMGRKAITWPLLYGP
jgi:hypothetical protein